MPTAKPKQAFPRASSVTIADRKCSPWTAVTVAADGEVNFENKDTSAYRLRLLRKKTSRKASAFDILLPASSTVTLMMKKNEEAYYIMADVTGDVEIGGGPIKGGPHK